VQVIWPATQDPDPEPTDADLERLYAFPASPTRPWVRVNFVSSLDGAVSVEGRSAGLSGPADKKIFLLSRDLADVVLVGVGTALSEEYHGVKRTEVRTERRRRLGLAEIPPIALVTRTCSIPPDAPVLTDTLVPPLVITCAAAPAERRAALAAAGADVVVAGTEQVDLAVAMRALDERGLRRVTCEGGPQLFGSLIAADLVDELCLTVSPLLVGGDAARIARGTLPPAPRRMHLDSVLQADGFLFLRYLRQAR